MVYLIIVVTAVLLCIFVYIFAGITFSGLPVLMYHKVTSSGTADSLTISTQQLERQFLHLIKKKYSTIFLGDLLDFIDGKKKLPAKPMLLTFDDGYQNNYTCLYPLLEKYGMKANIFLVADFIQTSTSSPSPKTEYLHIDQIRMMSSDFVQYGLHSFDHKSYDDLSIPQIAEDVKQCQRQFDQLDIPYQPCLAYTYGAYPKKDSVKRNQLFKILQASGIKLAFRIGNRINKIPIRNKFLIQRIDVRGDESFSRFRFALVAGKKILLK